MSWIEKTKAYEPAPVIIATCGILSAIIIVELTGNNRANLAQETARHCERCWNKSSKISRNCCGG